MEYVTTDTELTSIANAIRTKGGTSESLVYPNGFVNAIGGIPTGGVDLTSEDEGKVVVDDNGSYVLQAQTSLSISSNGTYDTTTNNEVVVSVSGGGGGGSSSVLVSKTITANGTYDPADDNADGYSSVTVNISGITWLEEVQTYADIATTYTTPSANDAVCVASTGESYVYDGTQWVLVWVEYTYAETMQVLEAS